MVSMIAEKRFEADKRYVYGALQDARGYSTDADPSGVKAKSIYERLTRAGGMMRPWSTDGTTEQSRKAIDFLREITSFLSEKIGPASRREEQRHAARKSPAQLDREIAEALHGRR